MPKIKQQLDGIWQVGDIAARELSTSREYCLPPRDKPVSTRGTLRNCVNYTRVAGQWFKRLSKVDGVAILFCD